MIVPHRGTQRIHTQAPVGSAGFSGGCDDVEQITFFARGMLKSAISDGTTSNDLDDLKPTDAKYAGTDRDQEVWDMQGGKVK